MKKSTKLVSAVVVLAVLGGTYVGLNTYPKRKRQRAAVRRKAKQKCFP